MTEARSRRILRAIPLLLAICFLSFAAEAETGRYVFFSEQSTLVRTEGTAGVQRTYTITGTFELTTDFEAGKAFFSQVDARAVWSITSRTGSTTCSYLDPNDVFKMTSLAGAIVDDDKSIRFGGTADDGSSVQIMLTLADDHILLKGETIPPPNRAALFGFTLDAVARPRCEYGGGTGTAQDPYQIATATDLIALGESPEDYEKHFILTADIDLDPNLPGRKVFDRAVIAPDVDPNPGASEREGFTGVFDGNGHVISHLTIIGGGSYLGLFGQQGYFGPRNIFMGEVKNLGVVDVSIAGSGFFVGGLIGCNWGNVTNCYSTGAITGKGRVGGLIGKSREADNEAYVTQCYSTGVVSGDRGVGGLVGENWGTHVTNCHSSGTVTGKGGPVGGLIGQNWNVGVRRQVPGTVADCYSTSVVSGDREVGGLVGLNQHSDVTNCCSTGAVSGNMVVGGLIGCNTGGRGKLGSVAGCYSTGTITGKKAVGGLIGINGRSDVTSCCSTGAVSGNWGVGGLIGNNSGSSGEPWSVAGCYSTGVVDGNECVGGLVGSNSWITVTSCYSTGNVSGTKSVGGLVGSSRDGLVTASFWDIQTSGQATSAGGKGKTTAQMQTASTFLEAGWDFVNVWGITENQTYPHLREYSIQQRISTRTKP